MLKRVGKSNSYLKISNLVLSMCLRDKFDQFIGTVIQYSFMFDEMECNDHYL